MYSKIKNCLNCKIVVRYRHKFYCKKCLISEKVLYDCDKCSKATPPEDINNGYCMNCSIDMYVNKVLHIDCEVCHWEFPVSELINGKCFDCRMDENFRRKD